MSEVKCCWAWIHAHGNLNREVSIVWKASRNDRNDRAPLREEQINPRSAGRKDGFKARVAKGNFASQWRLVGVFTATRRIADTRADPIERQEPVPPRNTHQSSLLNFIQHFIW